VVHSLTTATLQNVDYRKPITKKGETVVILEKIFAPLQAALLASALRREFMRITGVSPSSVNDETE